MYLKKIQMKNFRKYREDHNFFTFVNADGIKGKNISTDKEGKSDLDKDKQGSSAGRREVRPWQAKIGRR